jgi:hypothetical protein
MTDTELTPGEQQIVNANMDLEIARQQEVLERMTAETHRFRGTLQQAGWTIRLSDLELTAPNGPVQVQIQYAGGEFVAYVDNLPEEAKRLAFRITPALFTRQPACFAALAGILDHIARGGEFLVHHYASVSFGLEAFGVTDGAIADRTSILFGERAPEADEDDEVDPAERAQTDRDEGPPDMSGSTPGVER